jgi:hypothetical protein
MLLASSTLPLGMRKALSDFCPVGAKAFLFLSLFVPMLDVAPLSVTAEGIDPSRTPFFDFVDVVDLFIVVIVLLFDLTRGRSIG